MDALNSSIARNMTYQVKKSTFLKFNKPLNLASVAYGNQIGKSCRGSYRMDELRKVIRDQVASA